MVTLTTKEATIKTKKTAERGIKEERYRIKATKHGVN